jgi:tetratricopeptide (TPR) repeat protein
MTVPVLVLAAALGLSVQEMPEAPETEDAMQPAAETMATEPVEAAAPAMGSADEAIQRGLAAFARRRYAAAEEAFREAVAADSSSAAAAYYLGYTLYKRAEPRHRLTPQKQEAKALFVKAFQIDPSFRPVWAGPKK